MSKFVPGQKVYYAGNDPMELAFVKYGEEVILVTKPEDGQRLLVVRTLSGNKIWVSKSNLSESKPAQPKSKLDDSVDNFVKALNESISDKIRSVFLDKSVFKNIPPRASTATAYQMSFVKYTKNELPEPNKGVIINPYFGGKILAIFKDNHFYGCSYDVVLHKSAVEAWFYVDSAALDGDQSMIKGE